MDFFIQQAYGMKAIISALAEKWKTGTVILSPTDISQSQMIPFARSLNKKGMKTVIDPQCYNFHATKPKLISQSYWLHEYNTPLFDIDTIKWQMNELKSKYYDNFDSPFFIIPFPLITEVNEIVYSLFSIYFNSVKSLRIPNSYISIPLSSDIINDEKQLHLLLEYLEMYEFPGIYLIPMHPEGHYLVDNPVWLANLLDFCAGVKLSGKKIVVGYTNHQFLILGLTKVDAIASGNFLNSRSFSLDKFKTSADEDNLKRKRSTWFYSPQTLSEYQLLYLDMAKRVGCLDMLKPSEHFLTQETIPLFTGAQPSSVNFPEKYSFSHYLQCMKLQSNQIVLETYEKTYANLKLLFESAEGISSLLYDKGVRAKDRDYLKVYDATMSALDSFGQTRGLIMKMEWDSL